MEGVLQDDNTTLHFGGSYTNIRNSNPGGTDATAMVMGQRAESPGACGGTRTKTI
jgi:hypothetical protein